VISNAAIFDPNLSLEAKGLLLMYLAAEEGEVVSPEFVQEHSRADKATINRAFHNLIGRGYLKRGGKGEDGIWLFTVTDEVDYE